MDLKIQIKKLLIEINHNLAVFSFVNHEDKKDLEDAADLLRQVKAITEDE